MQPTPPLAPVDLAALAKITDPSERREFLIRIARERGVWTGATWEAWRREHPIPADAPGEDYDPEQARTQLGSRR